MKVTPFVKIQATPPPPNFLKHPMFTNIEGITPIQLSTLEALYSLFEDTTIVPSYVYRVTGMNEGFHVLTFRSSLTREHKTFKYQQIDYKGLSRLYRSMLKWDGRQFKRLPFPSPKSLIHTALLMEDEVATIKK